uniref:Uncharacterized protein n=1 Tax=Oryza glaberrima TaxID=4538 RepID=I1R0M0_ORYGL
TALGDEVPPPSSAAPDADLHPPPSRPTGPRFLPSAREPASAPPTGREGIKRFDQEDVDLVYGPLALDFAGLLLIAARAVIFLLRSEIGYNDIVQHRRLPVITDVFAPWSP